MSLDVFVIVGLLAIPAYLTAESTEQVTERLTGVSEASIEEHEAANFALAGGVVLGVAALGNSLSFDAAKRLRFG